MKQITNIINDTVNNKIWRANYPYYSKRIIYLKLFDIIWDKIIDKVGDAVIEVRHKSVLEIYVKCESLGQYGKPFR